MNEIDHLISIQTRLERIERLLKKEQEDDTVMTIKEASDYTKYSSSTIRRAIEKKELSCINQGNRKINGRLMFQKSSLTKWLQG